MTVWHDCEKSHPPAENIDLYCIDSIEVLFTDGTNLYVGYRRVYSEEEGYTPRWIQAGRDAYTVDNVTHWALKPALPGRSAELAGPFDTILKGVFNPAKSG